MAPVQDTEGVSEAADESESEELMRSRLIGSLSGSYPGSALSKALPADNDASNDEFQCIIKDPLSLSCFAEIRLDKGRPFDFEDDEDFDDELTDLDWLQNRDLLKNIETGDRSLCTSPTDELDDVQNENDVMGGFVGYHANVITSHVPYNPLKHVNNKPPFSFSCLIFMAIEESPVKKLPVKEIYGWIQAKFPFFRAAPNGWKNSVRHNLSLNKCFMKVEKDRGQGIGKGSYWCVDPNYRPNLLQALKRTPYHPFHQMQMISGAVGGVVNHLNDLPGADCEGGNQELIELKNDLSQPSPHIFPFLSRRITMTKVADTSDIDGANTLVLLKRSAGAGVHRRPLNSCNQRSRSPSPAETGSEIAKRLLRQKLKATRCLSPIVCTPNPSGDHLYCVTDDQIQAALLLSPSSSDIDEDFEDDDIDDDDDVEDTQEDEQNSKLFSLMKKMHSPTPEPCNEGNKDNNDVEEPARKKMTMSPKKNTPPSPQKVKNDCLSPPKVKKSRKPRKSSQTKSPMVSCTTGITTLPSSPRQGRKKSSAAHEIIAHERSKEVDAEAIEGADALLNLAGFLSSYSATRTIVPAEVNGHRAKRKVRGTEKQREIDQEKERKRHRALQREIDEEILLIKRTGEEQDLKAEQTERRRKLKESPKKKMDVVESDARSKTDAVMMHKHKEKSKAVAKVVKRNPSNLNILTVIGNDEPRKENVVDDKSTRKYRAKKVLTEAMAIEKKKSVVEVQVAEVRKRKQRRPMRIYLKSSKRGFTDSSALDKFASLANNNNTAVESLENNTAIREEGVIVQGKVIGEIKIEIKDEPIDE